MKDLKDFLNESLIDESIDILSAEKIVFDLLSDSAIKNRVRVSDDKLRDLANVIVDVFDEENTLFKVSKNNFREYLEDNSYFNILCAIDDNIDEEDCDLIYSILGKK